MNKPPILRYWKIIGPLENIRNWANWLVYFFICVFVNQERRKSHSKKTTMLHRLSWTPCLPILNQLPPGTHATRSNETHATRSDHISPIELAQKLRSHWITEVIFNAMMLLQLDIDIYSMKSLHGKYYVIKKWITYISSWIHQPTFLWAKDREHSTLF